METIIEKFLEIAIILIAAKFGAELMRRINQPAVIGEKRLGKSTSLKLDGTPRPRR